jgi:hypothetical protein
LLVAFGILFMTLAWASDADPKTLLLRWCAALLLATTALACWEARRRPRSLLRLPVPLVFVVIRVPTLRDRLPADLREAPSGPDFDALPFTPLYLLDDEFAAEIANRTMHGVMHLGLVPDQTGGSRVQMAVLVKPNGLLGTAYMAAIRPFRHRIVYPALLREGRDLWERAREPAPGTRDARARHG